MSRTLLLLGAAAAAVAQSTTVSFILPMLDPQPLVGSVIDADSTATTAAVGCAPDTPSESCGLTDSLTVTQGPSTYAMSYSFDGEGGKYYQKINCKLADDEDATCVISVSQSYDGTTTNMATTQVDTSGDLSSVMVPVTITAGANKLGDAAPAATTTATAPSTTADTSKSTTAAPTGSVTTNTKTDAPTSTESSTSTETSNAAMPMITQHVVLAGVAALVGGAMVL